MITLALVLPTAMQGIRAKVTDRVPWTMLGIGAGGNQGAFQVSDVGTLRRYQP